MSARPLATAAAASLAAGTCRVRLTRFTDPPPAPGIDLTFVEEGVADITRRRARLGVVSGGDGWEALVAMLIERYPWLNDEGHGGNTSSEVEGMRALMADHHRPGRTTVHGSSDPDATGRSPHDPLWIVEILRTARGPVGPFRVRPSRDEAAIQGEASCDEAGRFKRVTWSRNPRRRPRSLWRRPPAGRREWRTIELWDYGVEVAVEVERPGYQPQSCYAAARATWRLCRELCSRRREWKAQHA